MRDAAHSKGFQGGWNNVRLPSWVHRPVRESGELRFSTARSWRCAVSVAAALEAGDGLWFSRPSGHLRSISKVEEGGPREEGRGVRLGTASRRGLDLPSRARALEGVVFVLGASGQKLLTTRNSRKNSWEGATRGRRRWGTESPKMNSLTVSF